MFERDGTPDNKLERHAALSTATPRAAQVDDPDVRLYSELVGTFIPYSPTLYLE